MIDFYKLLSLADNRKSESPQLWIAGCSYAHGTGVDPRERFGQLLSNHLNLPVTFLTQPASSVAWAADQILRSDIRKDDIIVWAVTGSSRITFVDLKWHICHVTANNFDQHKHLDLFIKQNFLISNHMIYDSLIHIEEVISIVKKLGAKLYLGFMPCNRKEHDLIIHSYASSLKNAVILYDVDNYKFLDYGSDSIHPGPDQHKLYADQFLKLINENS